MKKKNATTKRLGKVATRSDKGRSFKAGKSLKSSFTRAGVRIMRPPGEPSFDYEEYVEAARALRRKAAA